MNILSYKTESINKKNANKKWVIIDAKDVVLGRLSSEIAKILRGKYKTNYTPHADCGDYVIVTNAEHVLMTGKKWKNRVYLSYTGYPGGQKSISPLGLKEKSPSLLVERAVKGMLPKNKLGRQLFRNLYVYNGEEHPHEAQTPTPVLLKK